MNKAYEEFTLGDLFREVASTGTMYAAEADGLDPFSTGKMDTLPKAMLYRVKVLEQYLDEIKARAYQLQQDEYDILTDQEKISYHENQATLGKEIIADNEDYEGWNHYVEPHLRQILIIASYKEEHKALPENHFKFGGK